MRASLIIPTYNRPELLARQLACVAQQQGGHIHEVLVCDDGSTTDTYAALAPFRGEVPNLKLLRQRDLGFRAGKARNMGIREASGNMLVFVDDNLLLPGDFIARHVAAHQEGVNGSPSRRVVLGFRYRTQTAPDHILPRTDEILAGDPDDRVETLGAEGAGIHGHPRAWFFVYSCNFSVPNDPGHVWFDENFVGWGMEDNELGYRLFKAGFHVVVQPTALVLHVEDPNPRDPFRCAERGMEPLYDSYVQNMVQFIDKYPGDRDVYDTLTADLRWYVRDGTGEHWIKNDQENDPAAVIVEARRLRRSIPDLQTPQPRSG